jgi:ketosteroid isomerase-like protein
MSTANPGMATVSKTSSRMLPISILFMLVLGGGILLWQFHSSSEEQKIQEVLENRANALGQKDLPLYLACFSPDYRSNTRTYDDLKTDASQWFSQFATIQFSFRTVDMQLQGDNAIVENDYKFSITNADGESVDIAKRELLEMRRENKEWKIIKSLTIQ